MVLGLSKHISQCGEMVLICTDVWAYLFPLKQRALKSSLETHSNQLSFFVKLKKSAWKHWHPPAEQRHFKAVHITLVLLQSGNAADRMNYSSMIKESLLWTVRSQKNLYAAQISTCFRFVGWKIYYEQLWIKLKMLLI